MPKFSEDDKTTQTITVLTEGTMVFQYRILKRLGAGGMGEVYLAFDTELKRQVALKFLLSRYCDDRKARVRFKGEAESVAKLDHPNIVTIFEVGEYKDRPFFVMQFIEGEDLHDVITNRTLKLDEIVEIISQVCEGLIEAHSRKILHRDLKPSNILIDQNARPRIVDFGISIILGDEPITRTGAIVGTPGYMAPEQSAGHNLDQRADLFSLGVVLYEMVTGVRPFRAEKGQTILYAVQHEEPKYPAELNPNVPQWLNNLIMRLLQKDPEDRISSAAEVLECISSKKVMFAVSSKSLEVLPKRRKSVTVLELRNLSDDKAWDYYCEGFTTTLINKLKQLTDLTVSSQPVEEMPKGIERQFELCRTDYITEGTLMRWKNRIRLTLAIHGDSDEELILNAEYEDSDDNQFKILNRATKEAADVLVDLSTVPTVDLLSEATPNLTAYDFYLKGCNLIKTHSKEDLNLAEEMFNHAIEIDPEMGLAHTGLAHVLISRYMAYHDRSENTISEARAAAEKALTSIPNHPEALRALGRYFMEIGKQGEAEKVLMKAVRHDPTYALGFRTLAWLKLSTGDLGQALRWAKKSLQYSPNDLETLLVISLVQIDSREWPSAFTILERALDINPKYGRAYYNLGVVYMKLGNPELALKNFQKAVDFRGDPNCYIDAGYVYMIQRDFENARKQFERTIEEKQLTFVGHYYLALTEKLAGNKKDSEKQLKLVLRELEKPDMTNGYSDYNLVFKAKSLAGLNEHRDAKNILEKYILDDISNGELLYFIARAFANLGDKENCLAFLNRSYEMPGGPTEKEAKLDPHFEELID